MKKIIYVVLALFFMSGVAFAASAGYSGPITSDRYFVGPVQVAGIVLVADGSNAASVVLRDGDSDSDTAVAEFHVKAGERISGMTLPLPIDFQSGCYVDAGSNSTIYLYGAKGIGPE